MIDPNIINEAYEEINDKGLIKEDTVPEGNSEKSQKIDPKIERVKKLVVDIQSILYKIQDDECTREYGKEDDDIRDEMNKAMSKAMHKMVDRLKDVLDGKEEEKDKEEKEKEEKDKEEDKEEKKDEEEDKESDDKKDDKKEDSDNDEAEKKDDKEENKDSKETKKDDDSNESKNNTSNFMKLFPTTEEIVSPQGKKYVIVEGNDKITLVKDVATGERFKIDTNILLKWKK